MTASWVRSKAAADTELCTFYENFDRSLSQIEIPRGVFSLNDLKDLGRERGLCPYFLTRYYISITYVSSYGIKLKFVSYNASTGT